MYRSSATYLKSLSKAKFKEFLDSFDTVLTDCDGNLLSYMYYMFTFKILYNIIY